MGDPAQADQELIVDYPYHDMTDEFNYHYGHYEIAANYMFMMDNLMDLTHLGYVHTSTIGGNPEENDKAEMTTTRTEHGAHYNRWMAGSTPPPSFIKAAGFENKIDPFYDQKGVLVMAPGPSERPLGSQNPTGHKTQFCVSNFVFFLYFKSIN